MIKNFVVVIIQRLLQLLCGTKVAPEFSSLSIRIPSEAIERNIAMMNGLRS